MPKKYFTVWIFFLVLLSQSCKTIPPLTQKREQIGSIYWRFYLQPFQKAKIYINGKRKKYKVIHSDKTLALLKLKLPLYKDKMGVDLKIYKKKFLPLKKRILLQKKHSEWKKKPLFFALDKTNSKHRFRYYWKSGKQPKSVTFVNKREVAVSLLGDKGIDIIHIESGHRRKIAPPQKWSKKKGFVESLVLEEKDELWVSQMHTNAIHVFDLETYSYKRTIQLSGKGIKVLAYDPQSGLVFGSNWISMDVSVIDVENNSEIYRIHLQGVPRGLWPSIDGKYLYAALFGRDSDMDEKGKLIKISLSTRKVIRELGDMGSKRHIVFSQKRKRMYLSDMKKNHIEIYNTEDEFLQKIKVYFKPNTISLTPNEEYLYVSCRGANHPDSYLKKGLDMGRIYVIDLNKNKIAEFWEAGNQPTGLAISEDGRYVVSSDFLDHSIRVYQINR